MSLGYLHQVYSDNEEKTVHEELREAFSQIQSMDMRLKDLEERMSTLSPPLSPSDSSPNLGEQKIILPLDQGELEGGVEEYTELLEQFNNIGGYEFENKIHQVSG